MANVADVRVLATADWQLGMPAAFLDDEARPRFAQARLDAVKMIGEIVRDQQVDLVVVGGDVFDSNQLDRSVVARAFDALRAIDAPVHLLPGNHDPLDAASIYRSRAFLDGCPAHVRVLDEPGAHEVAPGVDVVAAPWFSKAPLSDLVADALADLEPAPDRIRILVGHGDLLGVDRTDPKLISRSTLESALQTRLIDIAVLGDRHSLTEIAPRLWYPGTPEVTRQVETDPGHVLVFDIDETSREVEVSAVRVGRWAFVTHEAHLAGDADLADLADWVQAHPDKDTTWLRLQLVGTLTVGQRARLEAIVADAADRFATVTFWDRHTDLVVRPDDDEFGDLGLTGFAAEAVDDLTAMLDGPRADEARDALGLLYRLAGGDRP